jgi:hypothetical protein
MKRLTLIIMALLLMTMILPFTAAASPWPFGDEDTVQVGTVPAAAWELSRAMDMQMARRLGQYETPARGISIIITTPVELHYLESSSPLARQLSEEMAGWFVEAGYTVQEVRLAKSLLMRKGTGELMLTRDVELLASNKALSSNVVLMGTYTATSRNVRFNMQFIHTGTNTVLAKGSVTIPVTREIKPLLADVSASRHIQTSASTRLDR